MPRTRNGSTAIVRSGACSNPTGGRGVEPVVVSAVEPDRSVVPASSASTSSNALATSRADAKRARGSGSRHRSVRIASGAGRSRRSSRGSGARSVKRAAAIASAVPSLQGSSPVVSSKRITPSAKRSAGGPTSAPRTCSGAMYAGVPMMPVARASAAVARAMPKSVSTTRPS
ncbi:MAG: hypothetical protein M5U28_43345 [Sandaracinaceae bacterium]|nr:hypothetical protein [Sandaracinaceae bacterium]